jgi:hypothetical protein
MSGDNHTPCNENPANDAPPSPEQISAEQTTASPNGQTSASAPQAAPCPQEGGPENQPAVAPPRRTKSELLPDVVRLSLECVPSREISRKLGVPRQTIDRWLLEERQEWAKIAEEKAAQHYVATLARLEAAYREAMEAWRASRADKLTTFESDGDDDAKPKRSRRTVTQSGQAALLGKAIQAALEIDKFQERQLGAVRQAGAEAQKIAQQTARQKLAEELCSYDKEAFLQILDIVHDQTSLGGVPCRGPDELAAVLSQMSAAEYQALKEMLDNDYGRRLPKR